MEHHEAVYEQMMDINNANQGSEYNPHQIVPEMVVQNDSNQQSAVNCGMSGIEIMLPTECIPLPDQCQNNIILESNINEYVHQKQVTNETSHINNVEANINYSQSHTEEKIEQFIIQNPATFQENYESSNTIVLIANTENGDKEIISETNIDSNSMVSQMKNVEPVSEIVDNINVPNNSHSVVESYGEAENKQQSGNKLVDPKVNSNNSAEENIPTVQLDNMPNVNQVVSENIVEEPYSQNHSTAEQQTQETAYHNNSDSHYSNADPDSSETVDKANYPSEESLKEVEIVSSTENKILSQYNPAEHNSNVEVDQNNIESTQNCEMDKQNNSLTTQVLKQECASSQVETEKDLGVEKILSDDAAEQELKNVSDQLEEEQIAEDDDELDLQLSSSTSENQRKVIQDIFDDWQDENGDNEEDNNQTEHQDSVELELQNLLNEEQGTSSNVNVTYVTGSMLTAYDTHSNPNKSNDSTLTKQKITKTEKSPASNRRLSERSAKSTSVDISTTSSKSQEHSEYKSKFQSPRPGVKVPSHHLTSQIATKDEVTEVLKERLKEKQKDFTPPKTADVVFVKKMTARLSSKLANAAASNLSGIVPPISLNDDDKTKTSGESVKTSATDNKELLAILEGDDDDWSDLKGSTEDSSKTSSSESQNSKPITSLERELALKQLQELPSLLKKGSPGAAKNKIKKNAKPNKTDSKSADDENNKIDAVSSTESTEEDTSNSQKENAKENVESDVELNVEESRSGRKRKLTEKARQHELSVKRQKISKGKNTENKKKEPSQEPLETKSQEESKHEIPKLNESKLEVKLNKIETIKPFKSEEKRNKPKSESNSGDEINLETKTHLDKSKSTNKLGVSKKDSAISKRKLGKLAVKNALRQKMATKKAATKAKIQTDSTAKESSSTKGSPEKSTVSGAIVRPKKPSEIDKLLQDEGIVNMLYEAEQPESRRLVPITKSQKKIMDVDKAERELKLRTKLVRNAVMRLRNTNSATVKISPRSRRNIPSQQALTPTEKKPSAPAKSPKASTSTGPTDFMLPGKMQRNAADASRIIRRHSSSSFSSASASPRVSIDMPPESMRFDSPESQTKTKRKNSLDPEEKPEKKSKKKSISKTESDDETLSTTQEQVKKSKSNSGTASSKVTPKNKKVPKSRSSYDSNMEDPRSPEEITACLAEAANALSTLSSRSASTSANRKKGTINSSKIDDEKLDVKKLSSYKEINVKHHGHLVQLILTPSTSSSGVRNGITIQIMKELREALLILRKVDDCRVVLFTTTGTSFCEGLEVSQLLSPNKEERKRKAEEMAKTVKEFLKTLATFNKPIVAGVQGTAIGLGVTMLPLFDLVIASDKATFSTPYAKLGQIAEGTAVLTLSHSVGTAVTNELLLGGRTLTASEALRAGLVTRVLWPDRFSSELLPSIKSMSEQSSQSMEATKAILRRNLFEKIEIELESEAFLLIEHWCSMECQKAIQAYIDERGQ